MTPDCVVSNSTREDARGPRPGVLWRPGPVPTGRKAEAGRPVSAKGRCSARVVSGALPREGPDGVAREAPCVLSVAPVSGDPWRVPLLSASDLPGDRRTPPGSTRARSPPGPCTAGSGAGKSALACVPVRRARPEGPSEPGSGPWAGVGEPLPSPVGHGPGSPSAGRGSAGVGPRAMHGTGRAHGQA